MKSSVLIFLSVVALSYVVSVSAAKDEKRYPCKTKKKCSKEEGTCLHYEKEQCYGLKVDSLCKGASCRCCISSKSSCKCSPKCKFGGGICMDDKRAKVLCDGTIDKSACKGKKCVCCFPKEPCCMCGKLNTGATKVIGGTEVSPLHKFPWLVGVRSTAHADFGYVCAGAIINTDFIITSAFCVDFWNLTSKTAQVGVADFNQNSTDDDIPGVTSLLSVKKISVHKKYDKSTADNDIALLQLSTPVCLIKHDEIKPVCLPIDKDFCDDLEGEEAVVAGWGEKSLDPTGFATLEPTPDEATLTILDSNCDGLDITSNMMCAGTEAGGVSPFIKDVGAPLIVENDGRQVLAGVTIFLPSAANSMDINTSVYTRVDKYIKWIYKTTKKYGYYCG